MSHQMYLSEDLVLQKKNPVHVSIVLKDKE